MVVLSHQSKGQGHNKDSLLEAACGEDTGVLQSSERTMSNGGRLIGRSTRRPPRSQLTPRDATDPECVQLSFHTRPRLATAHHGRL